MKSLAEWAADLTARVTTSRALVTQALERIAAPEGEGGRAFVRVHRKAALAAADAADRLRAAGLVPSPLAGLPISVKDLFDERNEITRAASLTRDDAPPATRDSSVVAKLRAAGAVVIGRTNMTEFAYSGLGMNPHFGTPRNPWDREGARIPGGSSSGAAVSVSDGMAAAAVGTDTGGSVRIPAALCGLTGLKTTVGRISLVGCLPLSQTLDSAGPLAPSVACCALLDQVLRGAEPAPLTALPLPGLRLAVPQTLVLDDADRYVLDVFDAALRALSRAGARIVEIAFAELAEIAAASPHGGILGAEAWANHRHTLAARGDLIDPRVRTRIERGTHLTAADYLDLVRMRADLIARSVATTAPFDAILMPTVVRVAPTIAELDAADDVYAKMNLLMLRNTALGNFLERCALSLPIHEPGEAPVGLMLMGERDGDDRLLRVALAVEAALGR
jgi:aspartyl-tRNA(Asn)/glutamyl-tRNA(Gln) amidotransferase subunit A